MSLHRLSAGAGYKYLLNSTASGDCDRTGATPLTAYYTESGNPPGRWVGGDLAQHVAQSSVVREQLVGGVAGEVQLLTGVGIRRRGCPTRR